MTLHKIHPSQVTRIILVGLTSFCLFNCSSADTLGDKSPVEVTIPEQPTYANSIGELLTLKCGYCHAHPLPDLAPENIIDDLDLTVYETSIRDGKVIRGADAIGRYIRDGILDHDINLYNDTRGQTPVPIDIRQMPLSYGTPVTQTEKSALLAWANAGSPINDIILEPGGDGNAGAADWGKCNLCHGFTGDGLPNDDRLAGPALEIEVTTLAKVKSMWLWSQALQEGGVEPLEDQRAADLRAFIISLRQDNKINQD